MAYAVFNMESGSQKFNLLISKTKPGSIVQKGETYQNELCSDVYEARFQDWLVKQSGLLYFGDASTFLTLPLSTI